MVKILEEIIICQNVIYQEILYHYSVFSRWCFPMLLQGNISEIFFFFVQQQRNNNVIIMVVIMMMYFIIEEALVQIPPPTVKASPRDPKVGCQLLPGWNCQILQFPSKSMNLPSPWAKLLVIREQANPWLMHEAEQSHSAGSRLGCAVLTGRGMRGGHWAWHTGWGEHTHVLRE